MGNVKNNRRVRLTKALIRDSLIELLKEKELSQISVRELCERADINRSTFYAHYSDQYELIRQLESEMLSHVISFVDTRTRRVRQYEALTEMLRYFEQNGTLFLCLLGNSDFSSRIIDTIHTRYLEYYRENGELLRGKPEYKIEFLTAGSIRIVQCWLTKKNREKPEEMARIILSLYAE